MVMYLMPRLAPRAVEDFAARADEEVQLARKEQELKSQVGHRHCLPPGEWCKPRGSWDRV